MLEYPFCRQPSKFRNRLIRAATYSTNTSDVSAIDRVLVWLECFLQVADLRIHDSKTKLSEDRAVLALFVGAIFHPSLFDTTQSNRFVIASCFERALPKILRPTNLNLSLTKTSPELQRQTSLVDQCKLDRTAVQLWQGWPSINKTGGVSYLGLREVFETFGPEFTDKLFETLDEFLRARVRKTYSCLDALLRYLTKVGKEGVTPQQLCDPKYSTVFFGQFLIFYLEEGFKDGAGASYQHLATHWRNHFVFFARHFLITKGIIAEPKGGIPSPKGGRADSGSTHVVKTKGGTHIKKKLLTDIPLEVSDETTINLLFKQVKGDLASVKLWARHHTNLYYERYLTKIEMEKKGTIVPDLFPPGYNPDGRYELKRKWLVAQDNPHRFCNAAATFEHFGFQTGSDARLKRMYPLPLRETAEQLALPAFGTLLPFCALLIANHPEITPAFLESLEVYDDYGNLTGLNKTDAGKYLIGYKNRAGPICAQKKILLNQETEEVVERLIHITGPVRTYLRKRGDRAWRYLLISSGRGFAYPTRWNTKAGEGTPLKRHKLMSQFMSAGVSPGDAKQISAKLTLSRIRASAGVLVYLETHSVYQMAQALGQKEFDPRLMTRYLPEPIYRFFQERWIRIFQAGLVIKALEGSDFLMEASGFSDMTQIHEFLKNHALDIGSENVVETTKLSDKSEIVFGVNEEILVLFSCIANAVERAEQEVSGLAMYWAGIAGHLISYIDSSACHRPDIKAMLEAARTKAKCVNLETIIYE